MTLQKGFSMNKVVAHKVILGMVAVNTSAIRNRNKQKQQYIAPIRDVEIKSSPLEECVLGYELNS